MSSLLKATWKLRLFGLVKIPMLSYAWPAVIEMSDRRVVVKLPLNRRTKNHLNCMYFGALAIGADCAAGLLAVERIDASGKKVSLIFQDLKADFLKRAEGDVWFTCTQGEEISALVDRTLASGERESMPVQVTATVPSQLGDEPVAEFTLTLSLKRRD